MKLSESELQFIDTYLKHSGVDYRDIRFEMVDHVASALEQQEGLFYDNFRIYMMANKFSLLESYRHFKKIALRRAIRLLITNMIKPVPLLSAGVFGYTLYRVTANMGMPAIETLSAALQLVVLVAMVGIFLCRSFFNANKYSATDRLLWIAGIVVYAINFAVRPYHGLPSGKLVFAVSLTFSLYLLITALFAVKKLNKTYSLNFS